MFASTSQSTRITDCQSTRITDYLSVQKFPKSLNHGLSYVSCEFGQAWKSGCKLLQVSLFFYKKQSNVKVNMLNVVLDGNDPNEKLENWKVNISNALKQFVVGLMNNT